MSGFDKILDFEDDDDIAPATVPLLLSPIDERGDGDEEPQGTIPDFSISATFVDKGYSPITPEDVKDAKDGFDKVTDFEDDEDGENVVREEDVRCKLATSESQEALEKKKSSVRKIIIGIKEWVVELIHEGVDVTERTGSDKKAAREYTKEAVMPKITFAAPAKKMSFGKKLIIFLIACVAVGVYFGVEANSFFWFKNGDVESSFACAWSWIMVENLPTVMSPIHNGAFMAGFLLGFGILGIIGLFIWLDSDAKKHSRVGHEHGNARLGSKRDFTIYKRKFMD